MVLTPELLLLIGIAGLFWLLLGVKQQFGWRICVICLAVSLTWIAGLGLFHANAFDDPLLVAILMGQSVLGIYYLLERKLAEKWGIFRLPFLLTLTYAGIIALRIEIELGILALLTGLWLLSGWIFVYRSQPRMQAIADRVISCCRDW